MLFVEYTDETTEQPPRLLRAFAPMSHDAKVKQYVRILQAEVEAFSNLSPRAMGDAKQKITGLLTRIWEERSAEHYENAERNVAAANGDCASRSEPSA